MGPDGAMEMESRGLLHRPYSHFSYATVRRADDAGPVFIPGIIFFGGGAIPPKKELIVFPTQTTTKLCDLYLFSPGQRTTNISRELYFNGQ